MRAFVFSGGANRGALQAGAALALVEAGITPDLVVGSSVGSINAAALACMPNLQGAQAMVEHWRRVRREDIFPGNALAAAWRLLRGHGSLHPNRALRRFVARMLPPRQRRFSELSVPLFVTATHFDSGRLHVFGTTPQEHLIEPIMASCAVPPYLPPYRYQDTLYLDGGFVANLPISVAIEQGATEIWALEIGVDALASIPTFGLRSALARTIETLMRLQVNQQLELVRLMQETSVMVHHIQMLHYSGINVRNFRHSSELIDLGYASARLYLDERRQLATAALPQLPKRQRTLRPRRAVQARAAALMARWSSRPASTLPLELDISPPPVQPSQQG